MQEFDLVITLTQTPSEEQKEMVKYFTTAYQLANPEAKVLVITPRPPRG